jgi:DNA-3-methyladenine glycosylase
MELCMFPDFLEEPVEDVARRLLGCSLVRTIDGQQVTVRIVETEAYDQDDAASHAFRGPSARNGVMFGESGHLYVYFTYGMHYCCNVVSGRVGHGSGVLIRAGEPVTGVPFVEERRGVMGFNATNGPAKLCQALDITLALNGHDLGEQPVELQEGVLRPEESISRSPRIGISKATDLLRRFYITGNPYVSRGPRSMVGELLPT